MDRYWNQVVEDSCNEIYSFNGDTLNFFNVNRGARENLGYSKKDIIKLTTIDVKPHFTEESFRNHIEFLRQGNNRKMEFKTVHQRVDGSQYPVEVHLQYQEYRGIPLFTEFVIDITKRVKSENIIKKANIEIANQKYALDQSSIVAITDLEGTITYVNDMFCETSGYAREELIGQNHSILKSGYHSKEFMKDLWQTISNGRVWRGEMKNKMKNGDFYWVDTSIVPSLADDGSPYQYVSIRFDITEKINSRERIMMEQAKAMHSEKMASLGEMSAGIAHELGNPLAAIRGRIEMLQASIQEEGVDLESLRKLNEKVIKMIDRMHAIIRGMKSFARDGSGDPFRSASLKEIIFDVLEIFKERMRELQIEIHTEELNDNCLICCRETEIMQVIVNLVGNAKDAISNLEEKWISFNIEKADTEIILSVTDSGSGIDKDVSEKMFNPFYTSKEVSKGTGLGLGISRTIIESHGGTLTYDENHPNTRFLIKLPCLQP